MVKMSIRVEKLLNKIETLPFQHILPQIQEIKSLLQMGYKVDGQNNNGDTLLHIAVKSGNLRGYNTMQYKTEQEGESKPENVFDIAYLTAHYNPNPFIKNNQGMTPAMLAAHLKQTSAWQFLSSYERSYEVACQSIILETLYKKQCGDCASHTNIMQTICQLRGNQNIRDM